MRNETLTSIAERKSLLFFAMYCITGAVLLVISSFVRWDTIRRFVDFQSAMELRDWRVRNIILYVLVAVLTTFIMFRFIRKSAVSKVEGVQVRDRTKKYSEFKGPLIIKACIIQFLLLAISLAVPVFLFGGGFGVITYHLVRVGVFHLVVVLITMLGIVMLDPEAASSGRAGVPAAARSPRRWNT